ncbi:MAG TPA: secretin, partial [Beijerinckiaceae bacterium]
DPAASAASGTTSGGQTGKVINSLTIRGRDQVMLRVAISEVQRSVMKQLGVTSIDAAGSWGKLAVSNALTDASSALNLGSTGTNGISGTLKALERYGVARVLAEPSVTTVSGESAKFVAGGEVPVPSGVTCTTDASGRQTCAPGGATFKQYGVSLNFSPVVLAEGRILLRVATEVTEVDNTQSAIISGSTVLGFRTRKNETTVELPSGGSIVSAGLLQVKSRHAINGLPGLMNLPILGTLFRSREFQREETELLIVVTPYIVKAVSPSALVRPDDGLSDSSDPQAWLLGRVNRLYSTTSNPAAAKGFQGRIGFIID